MASSGCIDVQVVSLSGRCLEVRMNAEASVADLKLRAYVAWGLPPLCQELLSGADMMENTAKLSTYIADASQPLQITMLVRLDSAKNNLSSEDPVERKEAVVAMAFVANKDEDAFQSITQACTDPGYGSRIVQTAAVEVLVKLAQKGNGPRIEQIVDSICKICSTVDEAAAVVALVRIAPKGHQQICGLLKNCAEEEVYRTGAPMFPVIGSTATSAFCNIAEPGDEAAICWVVSVLRLKTSRKICAAAASGIALLASRGHAEVVKSLCELIEGDDNGTVLHERIPVLLAALTSLQKLAHTGDLQVVASAITCAKSGNTNVMQLAVQVLGQLAPFGQEDAIAATAACLSHKHRGLRKAAAQALSKISQKGDEKIVSGMLKYFENYVEGWNARSGEGLEIGEMLHYLAEKGDERVSSAVYPYLDAFKDWVKQAAIEVLGFTAAHDDERAISACIEATKLSIASVAQAAVVALMRIAGLRHEPAMLAACECLKHRDSWVRRSAAEAFSEVPERGNKAVVGALCICCSEDTDGEVVQKAAHALGNIVEHGDCEVTAVLSSLLEHRDEWSRRAGAAALVKVAAVGDKVAIDALLQCLRDDFRYSNDEVVLELSIKALAKIAVRGNEQVTEAVLLSLDHKKKDVREASLAACEAIATQGDTNAIALLSEHLRNSRAVVKVAALTALGMIVTQEDQTTLPLLYKELSHPKSTVRQAALQALQQITGVLETQDSD